MHRYIPNSNEDKKEMLQTIGVNTIEDLFNDIPEEVRLNRDLDLEESLSEIEVEKRMKALGKKNKSLDDLTCFLGAGAYDHYVPSIIKHITSRSEFYTAYTPYQPEISQGTLQVIFEYQTLISNITGMDVANASMYDGPTAAAEAAIMAVSATRRDKIVISKSVDPQIRKVVKTYMKYKDIEVVEVDIKDGVTDNEKLKSLVDKTTAGVIVQNPNFFGIIEDLTEVEQITHDVKAKLIDYIDIISLGILKSPGEQGVDIVIGDGQSLGNGLNFGGPYLGFLATTKKLVRKIPGRVVGQTIDVDGKRAFVLTLQAREQHIRRYKATSNICSNQALNALAATIYLTTMGKQGLKEVANQCLQKSHYTYNKLTESGKYKPLFNKPFFKEFALTSENSSKVNSKLLENNILGGYELGKDYDEFNNGLLFAVTEKRTKGEMDNLAEIMEVI